jgi:hypothetical protein
VSYADDVLFGWRGVCIGCRRWRCAQLIYEDDDNITDLTPRNCSDYCWADQVWSVGPVAAGSGPVASPPYTAAAQAALLFCVAAHRRHIVVPTKPRLRRATAATGSGRGYDLVAHRSMAVPCRASSYAPYTAGRQYTA